MTVLRKTCASTYTPLVSFVFVLQLKLENEHSKKAWDLEREDLESTLSTTKKELQETQTKMKQGKVRENKSDKKIQEKIYIYT